MENNFVLNLEASYKHNKFVNMENNFILNLEASYKHNKLVNT